MGERGARRGFLGAVGDGIDEQLEGRCGTVARRALPGGHRSQVRAPRCLPATAAQAGSTPKLAGARDGVAKGRQARHRRAPGRDARVPAGNRRSRRSRPKPWPAAGRLVVGIEIAAHPTAAVVDGERPGPAAAASLRARTRVRAATGGAGDGRFIRPGSSIRGPRRRAATPRISSRASGALRPDERAFVALRQLRAAYRGPARGRRGVWVSPARRRLTRGGSAEIARAPARFGSLQRAHGAGGRTGARAAARSVPRSVCSPRFGAHERMRLPQTRPRAGLSPLLALGGVRREGAEGSTRSRRVGRRGSTSSSGRTATTTAGTSSARIDGRVEQDARRPGRSASIFDVGARARRPATMNARNRISAALVTSRPVRPMPRIDRRSSCRRSASYSSRMRGEDEDLVVHREAEQEREHHQRDPRRRSSRSPRCPRSPPSRGRSARRAPARPTRPPR